ncbi:TMV resistance protein N-like [Durio zibethinus]|uniref:TMV resistance protein N-like n=1 Tax=Durio zibethinus TaxID=66656 RepID=A0A6P5Y1B7_DURZI|nr:TMV resistance protein N-like [Durio zibethinus]
MASIQFSEASSSTPKSKYEVFLSFRGEDTRTNFTDHLYAALIRAGVNTFRDDNELSRGKDISSELLKAIKESKISIVVFSKGYAYSRWCLNELVKIIECKNTIGQIVIPIFYDVDPSDIRKQIGSYAQAFAEHEKRFEADMEMIKRWRAALSEAADLSGWDLRNFANGHESKFIQKIVEDVLKNVNRIYLQVATHPVALESRVEKVMELLNMGSDHVRIVGIYGMGGIGKTTIAKAVYNSTRDGFDGSSFLSDIKDISKKTNGLASIHQQLLSDILNLKSIRIHNVDRGINLIQERMCHRRVLIVLDDVDESTQLNSLVGDLKWYGVGSRIIVTTRDERLLTELEVDERYNVEELNPEESLQLFNWHAFRRPNPKDGYFQLSKSVVDHVQGLPLALEVLGSHLFKRSQLEWESVVEKLRHIPHNGIQKKLRVSFDTLDDQVKAIFLDIACFFIGMDKEYVMKILDGCGFFPVIGVNVLLERSLIKIDHQRDHTLIKMHDLLRDMGREIVREESPNHIGKRSRLWFHEDVVNVLKTHKGTEAVEGLSLDASACREDVIVSNTEALAKMINLRLLKINSVCFTSGSYEKFSKELRWLCWHRCSLKVLPSNLDLDNMVALEMRFSNVRKVWKETKFIHKLKILDLSYSIYLVKTPNFAGLLNLERLEFEGCTSLTKVHQSIGQLERLVILNLADCNNLRELPDSICNLRSLETMNLNGCTKLNRLPEHLGKLEALRRLLANGSAIKQLPISLGLLKNLEELLLAVRKEGLTTKSLSPSFSRWVSPRSAGSPTLLPATFTHLSSLTKLDLSYRNLSDDDISIDFGSFQFLKSLILEGNKFYRPPVGISNLPRLFELYLNDCENLQSIPELPLNLLYFEARQCTSINRYPNLFKAGAKIKRLKITNCLETMDMWDLRHLSTEGNYLMWEEVPKGNFRSKTKHLEACFPGREVPDWFDYKEMGSSILFRVPLFSTGETRAMIDDTWKNYMTNQDIRQDHTWISYMTTDEFVSLKVDEGDEIEVSVEAHGKILVKKCGIHLPIHQIQVKHESKFIQKIVEDVLKRVNRVYLHIATQPVALEPRFDKVMALLSMGSDDGVHMVGIYGKGGIVKTIIAKVVYNSLCDRFDGRSFFQMLKISLSNLMVLLAYKDNSFLTS